MLERPKGNQHCLWRTLHKYKSLWLQSLKCMSNSANGLAAAAELQVASEQNLDKTCTLQLTCSCQAARAQPHTTLWSSRFIPWGLRSQVKGCLKLTRFKRTTSTALASRSSGEESLVIWALPVGETFHLLYHTKSMHTGNPLKAWKLRC